MRRYCRYAITLAVVAAFFALGAPAGAQTSGGGQPGSVEPAPNAVPGQYVVTLRTPAAWSPGVASVLAGRHGGRVVTTYSHALSGYAARMTATQADELSHDPAVASVAQDGYVHAAQSPTPSWGLDRIDQRDLPARQLLHAHG